MFRSRVLIVITSLLLLSDIYIVTVYSITYIRPPYPHDEFLAIKIPIDKIDHSDLKDALDS